TAKPVFTRSLLSSFPYILSSLRARNGTKKKKKNITKQKPMGTEISEPLLLDSGGGSIKAVHSSADPERVPEWKEQITIRGLVVSAVLGVLFCIITHKLNLTVGIIPSLNVAAGLLGFFFVKSWTGFLSRLGLTVAPFTKQENTVIQTCVVACYGLAFSGGFGSYLVAMDNKTYNLIGADYTGNRAEDIKNPGLGWMIGFMFVVSFLGIFSLTPLRKLTYPSGTATAMLINSFHTHTGAELAGKQVSCLGKYLSISFIWSCFKWFFSGVGDSCGFDNFPTLGLTLFKNTFYFDFSPTYVGCGLICPHIVNCSVLLGAIISWGFLWPYVSQHAGDWYPADLGSNDFKGLYGYKKRKRDKVFLKDKIPTWFAASGYVGLAAISTATIPIIFPPLKWYLVLCSYVIAPALAFCNSYGCGLTDWSLASTYGKIGLFIIASLVGSDGGVIAGLAACGVMMAIVSTAADLMQDFKTGYLTLSSAKSMFVSQLVGTAMGCVIAPLTFWLFWSAFDIGDPDGPYKAPYAVIFREMAILGTEGFSELPKHCLAMCCGFFVAALLVNLLRDVTPKKISQFIPIPMAMSVPFYIGAYFAIDMFVGTVILFVWERINRKDAEDYAGAVASGLICGDGIWTIPSAILSIFRINPPICIAFTYNVPADAECLTFAIADHDTSELLLEKRKRDEVFLKDKTPTWFAASGYVGLVAISTATIPIIFPPLKWYLVLCSYVIAPALAFCNSYGCGLTDWSLASTYGKIGLFIIASLVGSDGGVVAGLAACGVMTSIVSTAADLMQDFKTGYLTLSSAKSMFVSQLVGTAMDCVVAPLTFWLFWSAFDIGDPDGPYKAPYAVIFREMAILGTEGFSELPKHCLAMCCGFFVGVLVVNLLRDVTPKKISQFISIPMAMSVTFYIGAYFAIDMFVGTVILFVWERINRKDAEDYAGIVASGLICGDGIWTIPSAILSIFRINPPICMYFGPTSSS
ncbi:putative metal-nicotianamine transporter ysl6, partial [Turnera subulata]